MKYYPCIKVERVTIRKIHIKIKFSLFVRCFVGVYMHVPLGLLSAAVCELTETAWAVLEFLAVERELSRHVFVNSIVTN